MTGIWRAIYETFNLDYPDKYEQPSDETKRQRHLMHEQIRKSKFKLKKKKKKIIELPDRVTPHS